MIINSVAASDNICVCLLVCLFLCLVACLNASCLVECWVLVFVLKTGLLPVTHNMPRCHVSCFLQLLLCVGYAAWLLAWLLDELIAWLIGWLVDWLIGCLVDWLIGWLAGLVGPSPGPAPLCQLEPTRANQPNNEPTQTKQWVNRPNPRKHRKHGTLHKSKPTNTNIDKITITMPPCNSLPMLINRKCLMVDCYNLDWLECDSTAWARFLGCPIKQPINHQADNTTLKPWGS